MSQPAKRPPPQPSMSDVHRSVSNAGAAVRKLVEQSRHKISESRTLLKQHDKP